MSQNLKNLDKILDSILHRLGTLEEVTLPRDKYKNAEALSEGAFAGTVGLLSELATCKQLCEDKQECCRGNFDLLIQKLQKDAQDFKEYMEINIQNIKEYINKWLR